MAKIRVIVVDDSQVMRDMIAQIVRGEPDMEVAATAQDPFDAREKIKALSPDLAKRIATLTDSISVNLDDEIDGDVAL